MTMSNFSIENIGAFELNHGTISVVDRALEATTHGPAPTSVHAGCNRIGDGALEAMVVTGPNLGPPTGRGWTGACCGRIDDGALEASAHAAPPMTMIPCPFRIDDGALEASVGFATPTGNAWTQVCCRRIDDSTN